MNQGRRRAIDPQSSINRRQFLGFSSGLAFLAAAAPRSFAGAFKPIDIGPLEELAKDGISEKFVRHNFFLVGHQGRLFATIATCPHKGNYLLRDASDPTRIVCSGHDAVFDSEGKPLSGPVKTGLPRFHISLNPARRILVDPNKEFPQPRWNAKGSYLELPKKK